MKEFHANRLSYWRPAHLADLSKGSAPLKNVREIFWGDERKKKTKKQPRNHWEKNKGPGILTRTKPKCEKEKLKRSQGFIKRQSRKSARRCWERGWPKNTGKVRFGINNNKRRRKKKERSSPTS